MDDLPWEDPLLERKVESDLKDLLKTMVAFANSVRPDHTAVILIGEQDDGTAFGVANPDNIQKKVRETADKIYPPINWRSKVYEKDGNHCIRVEIEPSGDTPHFGGRAWIRKGSETILASDEMFQKLIGLRLSKVYELSKWVGSEVTVIGDVSTPNRIHSHDHSQDIHPRWGTATVILVDLNHFWATFEFSGSHRVSEPLSKLTLSWDDENNRLTVLVSI